MLPPENIITVPGAQYRVLLNIERTEPYDGEPCKHCGPTYEKLHRRSAPPVDDYKTTHWILPRAVEVTSDGDGAGYACLDCIVEMAPDVPTYDRPICPGPDCEYCSHKLCEKHGIQPCLCTTEDRHYPGSHDQYRSANPNAL